VSFTLSILLLASGDLLVAIGLIAARLRAIGPVLLVALGQHNG
jgi:hypothetical protein